MFPTEIIGNIGKYCNYFTYKNLTSTSKLYYKNKYNHEMRCHYILRPIIDIEELTNIFMTACYYNDTYMIKLIINREHYVPMSKYYYIEPFFEINENLIKYIIEKISMNDLGYYTFFEYSCKYGFIKIVKFLMETKLLEPFRNNHLTHNRYDTVCKYGHDNIAKYMIDSYAEKRTDNYEIINPPLIHNRMKLIKFLLNKGYYDILYNYHAEPNDQLSQLIKNLLLTHNEEIINIFINRYPEIQNYGNNFQYFIVLLENKRRSYESLKLIFDKFPRLLDGTTILNNINKDNIYRLIINKFIEDKNLDILKFLINKFNFNLKFEIILKCTNDRNVIKDILSLYNY